MAPFRWPLLRSTDFTAPRTERKDCNFNVLPLLRQVKIIATDFSPTPPTYTKFQIGFAVNAPRKIQKKCPKTVQILSILYSLGPRKWTDNGNRNVLGVGWGWRSKFGGQIIQIFFGTRIRNENCGRLEPSTAALSHLLCESAASCKAPNPKFLWKSGFHL